MSVPIFVVDAFASRPFEGNPAGVCLLDHNASATWMQAVAAEMKHAETAFVVSGEKEYSLRWFTPTTEVDLCGHATLAAAHVLWETGRLAESEAAVFATRSGRLECTRHGYGIQMDFPVEPADSARAVDAKSILDALHLGALPATLSANRMDILVEVESEDQVRACQPDMDLLANIDARGVILTARSEAPDYDFVSRFFAPAAGVPEDPVTGSAHCFLTPHWAAKLGKTDLVGYQCSARGGTVRVAMRGDRVLLQGHAITVLVGSLIV